MRKTTAEYSRISREKNKNNHKYRLRKLLEGARVRAKRYNIVCDLTLEDLIDLYPKDNLCPVLNIPLFWGSSGKGNRNNSPSLDRIDPKGNYSKDNICIISWRANLLKSDASLEEIEALYMYMKT
jgi:hypothetical protein